MEEHTRENPRCSIPECWCHTDNDYQQLVEREQATDRRQQAEQQELATFAYKFLKIQEAQ